MTEIEWRTCVNERNNYYVTVNLLLRNELNAYLGYWNMQRRHYPICSSVFWHNTQWPNSIRSQMLYRILIRLNLTNSTQRYQLLRNGWNRTILISKPIFSLLREEFVMRYLTVSLYFSKYTVKAQLTDQRIQPAENYIMEHRNLLPIPDFSDRIPNFKQLNLSLKEHFFHRQYTIICLEALKMIIINLKMSLTLISYIRIIWLQKWVHLIKNWNLYFFYFIINFWIK